jgi:hypothetical protein
LTYFLYIFLTTLSLQEPVRSHSSASTNHSNILRSYTSTISTSHPQKECPLQYIPFVGEAPEVLVAFGDAAAALDDLARIELTAEAAAEEAATAAIEDASGRLGMDDSLRGAISERPISCAAAREVSRARARCVKEIILSSFEGWIAWKEILYMK